MLPDNYFANQTVELLLIAQPFTDTFQQQTIAGSNFIGSQTIAFVDANIADAAMVMSNLRSDVKILLDPSKDGITQISESLRNYYGVTGIEIISHGDIGQVQLGKSTLSTNSLPQYASYLQQWKTALAPGADLLFYGCNVAAGASGEDFINQIGNLTGADVAASTNVTGSRDRGGDWVLEYNTGSIETATPLTSAEIETYQGILALTYLSDLTATAATNGWGAIEKDKSNGEQGASDGDTITLNGVTYAKGLGVHAASDTTYNLGGNYTRFISDLGVDDEVVSNGSVVFQVLADGVQIYDSGAMTGISATKTVDVDVTGKQNLRLVVTDGGNGNGYDHADWANARLDSGAPIPGTTVYLSDLTATAATNGWGAIEKDKSNGEQGATDGNTLTLNGVTYAKGLGVHASSDTTYALGGNYTRFISDIGVDDEVGSNGSVIFQVLADGVQIYTSRAMNGSSATKTVDVDVTGKQNLRLVVTDGGNGNGYDHADWANARLTSAPSEPDTSPPNPTLTAAPIGTSISAPYTFTVGYVDATAVNVSTINGTSQGSDVRFTGPNGFSQLAQLVSVTPNTNSQSVTATYQITAPDGIWNWNDRGTYTATLLAGEVRDTLGNATGSDTVLGTLQNTVESIFLVGINSSQVAEGNTVNIPIQRQGDATGTATIEYYTGGNSTAVPNVNYVPIPLTTLTFLPGETQKTVTLQTLNDGTLGTNKIVSLLIQNPTGADLGPSRTSSIAIRDTAAPVLTYLSDLPFAAASSGWGPVERDKSNGEEAAGDGKVLSLDGVPYTKGVGVHANSQITYNLGGAYDSFFAYVGVDDEVDAKGSVVFQILADGVLLFDSGIMTGDSNTKLANVDVTGKQTLSLVVNDGGNGDGYDHSDWADAQLVVGAYTPPTPPASSISRERVVGDLYQPTTFDWSPDAKLMFVAEKGGIVRTVIQPSNTLQTTPFIDISAQVNNVADRGLLGLAVDPFFGKNQGRDYVYLLFTYDPPETQGNTGLAGSDGDGNRPARLIRVTANPATNYTTALSDSEVVLLGNNSLWQYTSRPDLDSTNTDNINILPSGIVNGSSITAPAALIEDPDPSNIGRDYSATDTNFTNNNNIRDYLAGDSTSHSIGQIKFGLDGSLYVTVGDGTSYNSVDWRATRVQDVDNLSGKLLRINPLTGQGYADNPFANGNLDSNRSKVWSLGLRNSFRFTINPTTGIPYLGDVGWGVWEEIDVATKGSNFGWPYFEGNPQNAGYNTLPQAQAFYNSGQTVANPLLTRNHDASQNTDGRAATALIMGDFYTGNTLSTIYNGALFYNDVGLGTVYTTFLNPDGTVRSTQVFDNLPYIVNMKTGPDGYLYYASLYGNEIGRWKPA